MAFSFAPSPKKTLIYLGASNGGGLRAVFQQYNDVHAFEANYLCYENLKNQFAAYPQVTIIFGAVTDTPNVSTVIFYNCTDPSGNPLHKDGSSSLGHIDPNWHNDHTQFKMNPMTVPAIYLPTYCDHNNITLIDRYISDIQGSDLMVLKTMRNYLLHQQIGSIQCEVTKDGKHNIYKDLPTNEEREFNALLYPYGYKLISKGWTTLEREKFFEVPYEWWEHDCVWEADLARINKSEIKNKNNQHDKKLTFENLERTNGRVTTLENTVSALCDNASLLKRNISLTEQVCQLRSIAFSSLTLNPPQSTEPCTSTPLPTVEPGQTNGLPNNTETSGPSEF